MWEGWLPCNRLANQSLRSYRGQCRGSRTLHSCTWRPEGTGKQSEGVQSRRVLEFSMQRKQMVGKIGPDGRTGTEGSTIPLERGEVVEQGERGRCGGSRDDRRLAWHGGHAEEKGGVTDVRVDEACSQSCGLGSWRRGGTGYLCLGHVLAW